MTRLELLHGGGDDPDGRRARRLLRAERRGEFVRLAPAVFVDAGAWTSAEAADRHRARVEAVTPRIVERLIVSHASAVAIHGLPWIGEFPERVVVIDQRRTTGLQSKHVDRVGGAGRSIGITRSHGRMVTSLEVTAVDVALRHDRPRALGVLDAVLRRGITRDRLVEELEHRPRARASTRARRLIDLADGRADSVGESVTRLLAHDLGTPTPVLQEAFSDLAGTIGRVDFWFPEQGAIVEFDGLVKYTDARYRNGRSPEQVVVDEKIREDRLRALPRTRSVTRLLWRDVMPDGSAPTMLRAAGIPMSSRARTVPREH